jgi:hypothetical protein
MFLTAEELRELTGYRQRHAQERALALMGISYKLRPDSSIAVLKAHVEKEMGAAAVKQQKRSEPHWDGVNA